MRILGISAFHRDAAAALVVDGEPVAAAQEERFTRLSLDPAFPSRAIRYCLFEGGLTSVELDRVVFYEKPLRKFERVLALHLQSFPRSARSFSKSMFLWLGDRLWIKNRIASELGVAPGVVHFCEHERALAANAFFNSPFESAAVLTVDDAGEWATTTLGRGAGSELVLDAEVRYPHSLGLLASAVTQFLGFAPGEEEHKVAALAALGTPTYRDALLALVPARDGLFELDTRPLRLAFDAEHLYGEELEERLGPPRFAGDPLLTRAPDARHADVAASLQAVLEERVLDLAGELRRRVPDAADLCFAGEVASNRHLNARLLADGPFRGLFVPAAPGKAGGALGAALDAHHRERPDAPRRSATRVDLGESIDERAEPGARELGSPSAARDHLLGRLAAGRPVAWVRGRMEFGRHSLGRRCLLADPRPAAAVPTLLGAVQQSEPFLPCRVAVPAERAADSFDLPPGADALLRLGHLSVRATDTLRAHAPSAVDAAGRAWPQLVDREVDPELHELLERFGASSGAPLLLLATFELRGSPMVRTEAEAVEAWRRSTLDCLVCGERVYEREAVEA